MSKCVQLTDNKSLKQCKLTVERHRLTSAKRCLPTPGSIGLAHSQLYSNKNIAFVTAVGCLGVEGSTRDINISIPWVGQGTTVYNCKQKGNSSNDQLEDHIIHTKA